MRITFRDNDNKSYWKNRWTNIEADIPMTNLEKYPLKFSNLVINDKKQIILEAGCGAGRILRYYHELKYNIIGIEFIKEAVDKLKVVDNSLKVEVGNILDLRFNDDYFDVILAFGLYHNFEKKDLDKALTETYRVMKKGAKICASIFQIFWLISSKGNIFSATNLLPSLFKNNCLISSKEKPSSLITPPSLSIIPTIFAPISDK